MPEQEFLPPRPPGRFHRPGPGPDGPPGYPGEDAPPWAGLPPVRPARPGGPRPGPADPGSPAGPGYPGDSGSAPGLPGPQPPPGPDGPREEEQVPPWAGPDSEADDGPPRDQPGAQGGRAGRPAPGGRAQRAAARRRRRWLIMLAGLAVVAGGVTAAVVVPGGPAPAPVTPGALITTFQPGELQTVPDACQTVPAATVQQYLPGPVKQAAPLAIDGTAESACNWTIDQAPVYRLLSGLGNEAFSATQVFRRGGAVTDVATVVVRFHNVIVTATLNGLEHSNQGNYGPVSLYELSATAQAFAQAAEAALH